VTAVALTTVEGSLTCDKCITGNVILKEWLLKVREGSKNQV
jgi:hypothetical protein